MLKIRPVLLGVAVVMAICSTMLFANRAVANREQAPLSVNGCYGSDCIIYDISSQSKCTQVSSSRGTGESRWYTAGLSLGVDQVVLQGEVVAYKLQWFNGSWSDWFVTGVNDIDGKYNTGNGSMRRMWSYFSDHAHLYIICKN